MTGWLDHVIDTRSHSLCVMFSVVGDLPICCSTFFRHHALEVLEPTSSQFDYFFIQVAMATAQVIFQRFYYSKSFVKYSIQVSDII